MTDQILVASEQSSDESFENRELSENMEKHFCQPCSEMEKKIEADVFCPTCNEYQCTECSKVHIRFKYMKTHKVVNVKHTTNKAAFLDMNGLDHCEKHGKLIEYFCQDDNKLCCSSCAIKEHRKCSNVEEITHVVEGSSGQTSIMMEMKKLKEKCKSAAKYLNENEKKMREQMQPLPGRIHDIRTSTCKLLFDFEENINVESKTLVERITAEYSKNRMRCDEIVNNIEHNLEILDFLSANGTLHQMFVAQHKVKRDLESTKIKVRSEQLMLEDVDIYLKYNESLEGLETITDKLMSLNTSIDKITIDSIFDGLPIKLEKITGIDINCCEDSSEETLYSGIDFLHSGELVALASRNQQFVVFSEQLEALKIVSLCERPIDILTMRRNEVAITYGEQIDIFNVNDNYETHLTRTIKDISAHHLICVKDEDDFIVGVHYYHSTDSDEDVEEDTDDSDSVDYEDENEEDNDNVEECDDDQNDAEIQTVENTEDVDYEEDEQKSDEDVENEIENMEVSAEITRSGTDEDSSSHTEESDHYSEKNEEVADGYDNSGNDDIDENSDAEEEHDYLTDEEREIASFKICMLSASGEKEESLDVDFPSNKYFYSTTNCAYISDSNKVVLSDDHEDTIEIYDVRNNSSVFVVDDRIKTPCGVAVGPYNCIFVCCSETNTICQISQTGRVMSSHVIDMDNPQLVCISKDKSKLAVSNSVDLYLFRITE